jgi:hypothetical protein
MERPGMQQWNKGPRLKGATMSGEGISGRIFRKTVQLEVTKQIVGTSIRLCKVSDGTLWRGRPPQN